MNIREKLQQLMPQQVWAELGVEQMSERQQELLADWALRLFRMGQHVVADIDEVKYDGHLVILDDGSRWEVEDSDIFTASMWGMLDKVLVADGEMWKLDESEKVSVVEDAR